MGTRVNYEIIGENGDRGVVLYANNSHPNVDPDIVFRLALRRHDLTVSKMVQLLLSKEYSSNGGNHRAGDPIFTIDLSPGDREYVLQARFGGTVQGIALDAARFTVIRDGTTTT